MMPSKETAHVAVGLKLLIEQFRNTTTLPKFLAVYLRRFQDLENVTWDVINKRLLGVAVGNQLDMLGDLVGEPRLGRNDTDYRSAVTLRIRVNRSQGRAEDVIDVADLASAETASYYEYDPAGFAVEIYNATSPLVVARMLYATKAVGTGGALVFTNWATTADIFKFDSASFPITGNVFTSAVVPPAERFPAALTLLPNSSGTVQGFSPSQMPQLELWLRGDAGVLVTSGHISTWQDQSGNGRSAQSDAFGDGPYFNAAGIGGLPTVDWVNPGDPDQLTLPAMPAFPAAEIVVVKKNDSGISQGLWVMGSAVSGDIHPHTDGVIYDDFASTTRQTTGTAPNAMTVAHIYAARGAPKYWQADYNGVNYYANASNAVGWGTLVLGANAAGGKFQGKIAELLLFSRILEAGERTRLTNYLIAKYNINLTPPVAPTVASISPNVGFRLTTGSTAPYLLTITGTNFDPACTVTIGGVAATNVTRVNSTTITCNCGTLGSAGQKDVAVTNPGPAIGTLTNGYRATTAKNWYRADVGTITSWTDLSANGNHLVSGPGAVSINATGVGSKPAMVFNGTSNYFRGPCAFNSANYTAYIVAKVTANTASNEGMFTLLGVAATGDNNSADSTLVYRGGVSLNNYRNGNPLSVITTGPANNVDFGLRSSCDGSNSNMKVNATVATPVAITGATNVAEIIFPCRYLTSTPQLFMPINIAEIIIFSGTNPTTAEDTDIRAYLSARYGITF